MMAMVVMALVTMSVAMSAVAREQRFVGRSQIVRLIRTADGNERKRREQYK